jgi:hypothetical protein
MRGILKKLDEASTSIISGVVVAAVSGCAGYFTGSFELVASFAMENPAACALWSALAFSLGAIVALLYDKLSKRAMAKRRERRLRDAFLAMSPRRKDLVRAALHQGTVELSGLDMDALALCNIGVFGMPPVANVLGGTPFSIRPEIARFVRDNEKELLG